MKKFVFLFLFINLYLYSASFKLPFSKIPKKIDGHLLEEEWGDSLKIDKFYEIMPGENIEPPVKTVAFLSYDGENFYVGFKCFDPEPEKIRARYADRDSTFADDMVGIFLDTFNDKRNALEFFVNPLGSQSDLTRKEPGEEDSSWDGIWYSKGRITKEGYEVEVAIPFKTLRYPKKEEIAFGFLIFRIYPRNFRHQIASAPFDRGRNCTLCQIDLLENIKIQTKQRKMELLPTFVYSPYYEREDFDLPLKRGNTKEDLGLSLSYSFTPNLILNSTINPDFSQVEADVAQIDVNTRFSLYYPEKRPFFLEGNQYFNLPLRLVYSRTIADPNWGIKLTGKEGKSSFGLFAVEDKITNFLFPSNQYSEIATLEEPSKNYGIRYKLDLLKDSNFGFIYLKRKGFKYYYDLYGIDGKIRAGENEFINILYAESKTKDPYLPEISQNFDGKEKEGHCLFLNFNHSSRNWNFDFSYLESSPNLRADLGFIPRVDVKNFQGYLSYTIWGNKSKFYSQLSPTVYFQYVKDFDGKTTDWEGVLEIQFELLKQIMGEGGYQRSMEYYNGVEYKKNNIYFRANSRFSKNMTAYFHFNYGDGVDYENNRKGKLLILDGQTDYRIGREIFLDFSGEHQRLNLSFGNLYKATYLYLKVLYHFNNSIFLRTIIQDGKIKRNVELYLNELPEKENFTSLQFLFTYKINPFTLFYLGFSTRGIEEPPYEFQTQNKTYFLKLSYSLWI